MTSEFQQLVTRSMRHWFKWEEIIENYRPEWLFGMEIDIFLPEIGLAIEVQGDQHYKFVAKYHQNYQDVEKQRQRDERKRQIIVQKGLKFISLRAPSGQRLRSDILADKLKKAFPDRNFPMLPIPILLLWRGYKLKTKRCKRKYA